MIVILNGSVGVGKTTVAWALNESFDKSVMLDGDVHTFWLTCSEDEQRRRVLKRKTDQWARELERFVELNTILEAASKRGDIGTKVDTTGRSVAEIAQIVRKVAI